MTSPRLTYAPLAPAHLNAFHALVQDDHIRRYMMDGLLQPREWSAARIADSEALFRRLGVGLWLAHDESGALVGFCGFLQMAEHSDPELVYALLARFCGNGYATEMATAAIAHARHHGFREIVAAVDEVNVASARVLEKLGFQRTEVREGAFGPMQLLELPAPGSSR